MVYRYYYNICLSEKICCERRYGQSWTQLKFNHRCRGRMIRAFLWKGKETLTSVSAIGKRSVHMVPTVTIDRVNEQRYTRAPYPFHKNQTSIIDPRKKLFSLRPNAVPPYADDMPIHQRKEVKRAQIHQYGAYVTLNREGSGSQTWYWTLRKALRFNKRSSIVSFYLNCCRCSIIGNYGLGVEG